MLFSHHSFSPLPIEGHCELLWCHKRTIKTNNTSVVQQEVSAHLFGSNLLPCYTLNTKLKNKFSAVVNREKWCDPSRSVSALWFWKVIWPSIRYLCPYIFHTVVRFIGGQCRTYKCTEIPCETSLNYNPFTSGLFLLLCWFLRSSYFGLRIWPWAFKRDWLGMVGRVDCTVVSPALCRIKRSNVIPGLNIIFCYSQVFKF